MITYAPRRRRGSDESDIGVYVDGRLTGTIRRSDVGFYYQTRKGGHCGESFATVAEVKASLEGSQ